MGTESDSKASLLFEAETMLFHSRLNDDMQEVVC